LALQFHILRSSAYNRQLDDREEGRSLIYRRKRTGPSTDPCGTPEVAGSEDERIEPTFTRKYLSERKFLTHSRRGFEIPKSDNLCKRRE